MMRRCVALVALLCAAGCAEDEPDVETNLDLVKFQGRWHEIARIPRDYDSACHDTVADYALVSSEQLEVRHTCFLGSATGSKREFRAMASVDDPAVPAKLSLQLGLYAGSYWILDVGDSYEYAVIGHPSRTMLWILARQPELDAATWNKALSFAQQQEFGTALLDKTPQSGGRH
jgi:apolipoprotein D and lipocalin family protein